jgi:hypothetical protein
MNGFTENRAPDASERPGPHEVVLSWGTSRAMLPLVGRIVADVVRDQARLAQLQPEQARLDLQRHTLPWPQRARRYQLREEIVTLEKDLGTALAELDSLGVVLLDAETGLVGFPTIVNDRRAYFAWRPEDEGLDFWSYAGDSTRRPVPEDWTRPPKEKPVRGKARPKK